MKIINYIALITFAILCILALIVAIVQKRFELVFLAFIFGAVSYVSYIDIKNPQYP